VRGGNNAITVDDGLLAAGIDRIDAKSEQDDGGKHGKGKKCGTQGDDLC
jgi:hypothetical protein